MTESAENILMWAHYADSHRGFVIEFDENDPFFNQRKGAEDELRHLRKVIYSSIRPSLRLTGFEGIAPLITKSSEWSYEREWRIMRPLIDASKKIGDGPEAIHLFDFPGKAVKSVILGNMMSDNKKLATLNLVAGTPEFKHVRCYSARIDDQLYQINVSEIP